MGKSFFVEKNILCPSKSLRIYTQIQMNRWTANGKLNLNTDLTNHFQRNLVPMFQIRQPRRSTYSICQRLLVEKSSTDRSVYQFFYDVQSFFLHSGIIYISMTKIRCPKIVRNYKQHMGYVDNADQLKST